MATHAPPPPRFIILLQPLHPSHLLTIPLFLKLFNIQSSIRLNIFPILQTVKLDNEEKTIKINANLPSLGSQNGRAASKINEPY
jgi:hypothetical protein